MFPALREHLLSCKGWNYAGAAVPVAAVESARPRSTKPPLVYRLGRKTATAIISRDQKAAGLWHDEAPACQLPTSTYW